MMPKVSLFLNQLIAEIFNANSKKPSLILDVKNLLFFLNLVLVG